jgi:hypothetical protein
MARKSVGVRENVYTTLFNKRDGKLALTEQIWDEDRAKFQKDINDELAPLVADPDLVLTLVGMTAYVQVNAE